MHEAKIVIGANYGDEGKGLMSRYFAKEALSLGTKPITIFHNGTAQRGHTVDYNETFRHVYHHFGAGTADGVPTYFAETFMVHPMEFRREWNELAESGITPVVYCDPKCYVITPFDMLTDHITEDYIEFLKGGREHGSCGFGSWCFTDRIIDAPDSAYTITDFAQFNIVPVLMRKVWSACLTQLFKRGVDPDKVPHWESFLNINSDRYKNAISHFISDLQFFVNHVHFVTFDGVWKTFDYTIFENAQGLGLDQNCGKEWHTTSNTGLVNPVMLLGNREFNGEVCYVSRAYLTRHGIGDLENEAKKSEINKTMLDKTNSPNPFQGSLRYGFLEDDEQASRITDDYSLVMGDKRFCCNMAVTHLNEFNECDTANIKYISDSKFEVKSQD